MGQGHTSRCDRGRAAVRQLKIFEFSERMVVSRSRRALARPVPIRYVTDQGLVASVTLAAPFSPFAPFAPNMPVSHDDAGWWVSRTAGAPPAAELRALAFRGRARGAPPRLPADPGGSYAGIWPARSPPRNSPGSMCRFSDTSLPSGP